MYNSFWCTALQAEICICSLASDQIDVLLAGNFKEHINLHRQSGSNNASSLEYGQKLAHSEHCRSAESQPAAFNQTRLGAGTHGGVGQ